MGQRTDGQQLNLKFSGLYVSANELSANPEGSMSIADDVVIDFTSLLQSRRGFGYLSGTLPSASHRFERLASFQSTLVARYDTNKLAYYNSVGPTWSLIAGTFADPDTSLAKVRTLKANQNLYLTSASGIQKLDSVTGTIRPAGGIKALDAAVATTGVTGFLATGNQIAYRMLWGYKDANSNLILGSVSNRAIATNSTGSSVDIIVTFTIPDNVTTSDFYQIYRSPASGGSTIEPVDQMQLVYEANPTAGQIITGTISVTDIIPDSLKGATLYTSPSEGGILQDNTRPPLSWDFTTFRNVTFYANTEGPQRLLFTIIAVGGTSGVASGDTITIAGTTYTGAAAEVIATGTFKVSTGGTPSQNIADTAQSLVRVINRYTTNTTVNAFYLSGYNDLPGQILIEEISLGGASFAATASAHTTAYRPNLPTSGTTVASTNDDYANALYFSKPNQPEAVPQTNLLFVGSASSAILRVIALRDSLFILKTEGIFRLTGTDSTSFVVEQFDLTTKLLAPDTATPLANEIWMLSDQGVVSVSDSGVQVRSRPIDTSLNTIIGRDLDGVIAKSFAVAYETDRKYILYVPASESDTYPSLSYVFNVFTSTWVRWTRGQTCAIVDPDTRKLVVGSPTTNQVSVERKSYTFRDYVDEETGTYTVTAVDSTNLLLVLNNVLDLTVGDVLYLNTTVSAVITSISPTSATVGVSSTTGFSAADSLTGFKAIRNKMEWNPASAQNPGRVKQWSEVTALFKSSRFFVASFRFRTDLSQAYASVDVLGVNAGGWGQFAWGGNPWGGVLNTKPLRTYVPQDKQLGSQLTFRIDIASGYSDWKMLGASLPYSDVSFETSK